MATPIANMLPFVHSTTYVETYSSPLGASWRLGPKGGGTCVAVEGPGAKSGPWGAESET